MEEEQQRQSDEELHHENDCRQISHPLCQLCSPSLPQGSSSNPTFPPLHPSHPSLIPSLPFSQCSRLPAHLSVHGSDAGEWSRLVSYQLWVPLLNEGKTHFPFQQMSRGRCNARAQEEKGSSNLWYPHDGPAKCVLSHLCLCVFSRCVFLSRSGKWMGGI